MIDKEVRFLLADVFEQLKDLRVETSSLMDQVAALRDVLKDASPRFSELFSQRLEHWQTQGAALKAETNKVLDETIRKLRDV